jgi:hypothetical protein
LGVLHHHAEAELWRGNHRTGAMDDFVHRGILIADDHWVSDHGPEPLKEIEHFGLGQ